MVVPPTDPTGVVASPFLQLLVAALLPRPGAAPLWPTETEMRPWPLKPRENSLTTLPRQEWQPCRFLSHLWGYAAFLVADNAYSQLDNSIVLSYRISSQTAFLHFALSLSPLVQAGGILAPIIPSYFWAKAGGG